MIGRSRVLALATVALALLSGADRPAAAQARAVANTQAAIDGPPADPAPAPANLPGFDPARLGATLQTVAVFAVAGLAPAAALMVTAFVRIQVVLTLLRQALGSPQVPGNQVLTALALLLTALVMRPQAEAVYRDAIRPWMEGRATPAEAWDAGSRPIQGFMIDQIHRAGNERYLAELYAYAEPPVDAESTPAEPPTDCDALPLRVVAPAFLLSELTLALTIGFAIYLPFLVIDLVVSSVLAAMGLVMLPPSLVAPPLKLAVFVMAGGWWLVAEMLLRSFATSAAPAGP